MLYIPHKQSINTVVERLERMGYPAVAPENPYWRDKGAVTIEDPDGWRLVLMPTPGIV